MIKYADDTYLIIPASGFNTRSAEINNITIWATLNNLTLNMAKTTEIIIHDSQRKQTHMPPALPGITRVDSFCVLGVTLTRRLSASEHIRRVISDCSQTQYALRVLRHHGLTDAGLLHTVFRSVIIAKLLYACSAWSGIITASDCHCVDTFLRRSKRCGYCQPDLPSFDQLVEDSDDRLFHKLYQLWTYTTLPTPTTKHSNNRESWPWIWSWIGPYGILSCITHQRTPTYVPNFTDIRRKIFWRSHLNFLPSSKSCDKKTRKTSKIRRRSSTLSHNRQLPACTGHLTDANFITRLLYKNY